MHQFKPVTVISVGFIKGIIDFFFNLCRSLETISFPQVFFVVFYTGNDFMESWCQKLPFGFNQCYES